MNVNKYMEAIKSNPSYKLDKEERIYFTVPYNVKDFAKSAHCEFDKEKKLWFTGLKNDYIKELIDVYEINDATSEKIKQELAEMLKNE